MSVSIVCQVVGKPNQLIPPYPLQKVPIFGEAFSKSVDRCSGAITNNAFRQSLIINNYVLNHAFSRGDSLKVTAPVTTGALFKYGFNRRKSM